MLMGNNTKAIASGQSACRQGHANECFVKIVLLPTAAPAVPAALLSLVAALPANAAGAGAELARPSTAAVQSTVQSTVQSVPKLLESSTIDQAVNSVVDAVKVMLQSRVQHCC